MSVLVLAKLATENLRSTVGDDLVGVHVEADAGSGLENVDHKGVVPLARSGLPWRLAMMALAVFASTSPSSRLASAAASFTMAMARISEGGRAVR